MFFNNPNSSAAMSTDYLDVAISKVSTPFNLASSLGQSYNNPLTLAFWMNTNMAYSATVMGLTGSSGSVGLQIDLGTDGRLSASASLSTALGTVAASSPASIMANTWHHVAVTITAANVLTLYINGVNIQTVSSGTVSLAACNIDRLVIGGSPSYSSKGFNGYLQDVRLYNVALSDKDVQTLFTYDGSTFAVPTATTSAKFSTAGAFTWTVPSGVTLAEVVVVGGGGGAGGNGPGDGGK
jgi:hypothetical protein